MNKEMLEITKKFHDTYEKLASEYTYETRKDTKVFDINSNNGKLMYATVNEIVSPILKENQKLKDRINKAVEYIEKCNKEEGLSMYVDTWQHLLPLLDVLKGEISNEK